jgi:hypothetical protein
VGWDRAVPVFRDGMILFFVWLVGWDESLFCLVGGTRTDGDENHQLIIFFNFK